MKDVGYREKLWFSLDTLANFIAEYNKDGKYDRTAWDFWHWLDRKSAPKK